jgi:protein-tyrosine phosphatase
VTASSLTGRFGQEPQKLAIRLLKEGKVDVIASDCHNLKSRPPNLSEGLREAAKIVGESAAKEMGYVNPKRLITNNQHLKRYL